MTTFLAAIAVAVLISAPIAMLVARAQRVSHNPKHSLAANPQPPAAERNGAHPEDDSSGTSPCAATLPPAGAPHPDPGVLESRIPELNPFAGAGVIALHSHTADQPCDHRCTEYARGSR